MDLAVDHKAFRAIASVRVAEQARVARARSLRWYEWIWTALPMILVLAGGAVGPFVGGLALYVSTRIFRSERSLRSKYVLSALVSGAATVLFVLAAGVLQRVKQLVG